MYKALVQNSESKYKGEWTMVKKVLKTCVHCRRFNARSIKLNQSFYRNERSCPSKVTFANIFLDHLGPYFVYEGNEKVKKWLLCITCMFTRAINLVVCNNLTTEEFIRALQLHSFHYGVATKIFSELFLCYL